LLWLSNVEKTEPRLPPSPPHLIVATPSTSRGQRPFGQPSRDRPLAALVRDDPLFSDEKMSTFGGGATVRTVPPFSSSGCVEGRISSPYVHQSVGGSSDRGEGIGSDGDGRSPVHRRLTVQDLTVQGSKSEKRTEPLGHRGGSLVNLAGGAEKDDSGNRIS
jgi:hypothetical protein